MCLELHSKKANKRGVLQELNRTWLLGNPKVGASRELSENLDELRRQLTAHPARLHARDEITQVSAYEIIGHLVRLRRAGVKPTDVQLPDASRWSPADRDRMRRWLADLAATIDQIDLPIRNPWRGTMLNVVLPTDLPRIADRISALQSALADAMNIAADLLTLLNTDCDDSVPAFRSLVALGTTVAGIPQCDSVALIAPSWDTRQQEIEELVHAGEDYSRARLELKDVFSDSAWVTDLTAARQAIATHGSNWLRWLYSDWRRADALVRSLSVGPRFKGTIARLSVLDKLISGHHAEKILERDKNLGSEAFGRLWQRERSDWPALRAILNWVATADNAGSSKQARQSGARVLEPAKAGALAKRLSTLMADIDQHQQAICTSIELSIDGAFGALSIEAVLMTELMTRCASWLDHIESLPKWIAYRVQADRLQELGLREFVARLGDGRLATASATHEFDMACYEAVLRAMAEKDPEIVAFDGHTHSRKIDEFKRLDLLRIDLARLEVAAAHHRALPPRQGAGPILVLRTELAKQKRLLPIRQLVKRAGAAMQAIKPVFMMSPLSVAQFLEPGVIEFDMLVIDEASQVRPVDALGAIARCRKLVVVGDERQLPPTTFFSKLVSDEEHDEEDESGAPIGLVESILGLCSACGVPERMLRWHYRSKHESLIAVSNREFYDNQLYIVPSPIIESASLGLRFHHIPQGTFDVGGTRSNRVEASSVASAVMQHAAAHPELSLGVVAFSVAQRRAIVDELELLRRQSDRTEGFFASAHPNEPFFVKNLENVQGDERDVMFISVGYGRNQQGRMLMRFPTLGSGGGERRLNVLITRGEAPLRDIQLNHR